MYGSASIHVFPDGEKDSQRSIPSIASACRPHRHQVHARFWARAIADLGSSLPLHSQKSKRSASAHSRCGSQSQHKKGLQARPSKINLHPIAYRVCLFSANHQFMSVRLDPVIERHKTSANSPLAGSKRAPKSEKIEQDGRDMEAEAEQKLARQASLPSGKLLQAASHPCHRQPHAAARIPAAAATIALCVDNDDEDFPRHTHASHPCTSSPRLFFCYTSSFYIKK